MFRKQIRCNADLFAIKLEQWKKRERKVLKPKSIMRFLYHESEGESTIIEAITARKNWKEDFAKGMMNTVARLFCEVLF